MTQYTLVCKRCTILCTQMHHMHQMFSTTKNSRSFVSALTRAGLPWREWSPTVRSLPYNPSAFSTDILVTYPFLPSSHFPGLKSTFPRSRCPIYPPPTIRNLLDILCPTSTRPSVDQPDCDSSPKCDDLSINCFYKNWQTFIPPFPIEIQ